MTSPTKKQNLKFVKI